MRTQMSVNLTTAIHDNSRLIHSSIRIALICVITLLLYPISSTAEIPDLRFKHLTIEDGLAQSNVSHIYQDSQGFMWFCSHDGLSRYDGNAIRIFRHTPGDSTTLSHSHVLFTYEDMNDTLWFGTWGGGLNKFDRDTETFTHYRHNPQDPSSISHDMVTFMMEDSKGTFWIATASGVDKFDKDNGKFTNIFYDPEDPGNLYYNYVSTLFEDSHGYLWIGTLSRGLFRFDHSTGEYRRYHHDNDKPTCISCNDISKNGIVEDSNGIIWISTKNGLNAYDRKTDDFRRFTHDPNDPFSISDNGLGQILIDSMGHFWICTDGGGLNLFDLTTKRVTHYRHNPLDPTSIISNDTPSIFEDDAHILWVGTFSSGASYTDLMQKKFGHYAVKLYKKNTLSHNIIRSILETRDGSIWVGTDGGGLNRLDPISGQFRQFTTRHDAPDMMHDDVIIMTFEDSDGDFWIGTYEDGLIHFNPNTGRVIERFHFDPNNPDTISSNFIRTMYEDSKGALWVGTVNGGLCLFDKKNRTFKRYLHDPRDPSSISNNIIVRIHEDSYGNLWMGTWGGGLNRYDSVNDSFVKYQHNEQDTTTIAHNTIVSIHEDSKKRLWFGTNGGLDLLDRDKGTFTHFTARDGLPNNVINGILEDNNENLWLGTNNGLCRFNPESKEIRNYTVSDGLQSNEFTFGSSCRTSTGIMYFGGINGITFFHPEEIADNIYIPPIVITGFLVFNGHVPIGPDDRGNTILTKSITSTKTIELSYRESVFSFEFSSLHYASPEQNHYAYYLEGFEKDWNYVDNRRFATYTNLPSGRYTFRVKGTNSDGFWNEKGTSVQLVITPPFWERFWFKSLGVFLLLITAITIHRVITENVKRRNRELENHNTQLNEQIHERKLAEQALKERENYFRSLFNSTNTGNSVLNTKGIILRVNGCQALMLGYTADSIENKPIIDFIHKEDCERVRSAISFIANGASNSVHIEIRLIRRDGSDFWADFSATGVKHDNGHEYSIICVIIDINERKRIEDALRESEEKHRSVVDNANIAIFVTQNKAIRFINPYCLTITGYTKNEVLNKSFAEFIHEDDREKVFEYHQKRLAGFSTQNLYEFRIYAKNKIIHWVELKPVAIMWGNNPAELNFMLDVTERKQLESQFIQSQKMETVGRLAGGIAHDFNNLLTVIRGNADLALMCIQPEEANYEEIMEIKTTVEQATTLTRQLLAFSRKEIIKPEPLDLGSTLNDMQKMLRRLIGEDIELVTIIGDDIRPIWIDPVQISQILSNLVINARDAISGIGTITLEAANRTLDAEYARIHSDVEPGDYVMLAVTDTGLGIDDDTLAHIFEPFFTTKEHGTGLGLATCYGIVKQNGGHIWVYSETNHGTTFKLYFPKTDTMSEPDTELAHTPVIPRGTETILIVEDEQSVRKMTTRLLRENGGYTVLEASNGEEAFTLMQNTPEQQIDLIVTDVIMPKMSGADLSRKVSELYPETKIIYVSGYTDNALFNNGVITEDVQFLAKPYSPIELLQKVRTVLDETS